MRERRELVEKESSSGKKLGPDERTYTQNLFLSSCRSQKWSSYLISLHISCFRAIFSFLTSKDDHYTSVLEEDGLLLVDRLGFAVTFLDDTRLEQFIEREWEGLLAAGRLDGVVLSGGDSDGVHLLQAYLDRYRTKGV